MNKKTVNFSLKELTLLFLDSLKVLPALIRDAFRVEPDAPLRQKCKRWVIMAGFMPIFCVLQLTHWFCFFLDELFFREYQKVKVFRPVIIVGPPRSGTTHLHRVLAEDSERFTTMKTWELFLAPSVFQKKLFHLASAIDRCMNRPISRFIAASDRLLQKTDTMHPSALHAPEEDYFLMCMTFTCSGLALLFPKNKRLWHYAFFDSNVHTRDKQLILKFYKACLQKHLYVVGKDKILLSKNASFNPWLKSLNQEFPDALFIVCARDPMEAVPSMLSVANAARCSFGGSASATDFDKNMIALMKHHYISLLNILPQLPVQRRIVMPIKHLHNRLRSSVLSIYQQFGFPINESFAIKLNNLNHKSRRYKSAHRYSVDNLNLSKDQLNEEFQFAYFLLSDYAPTFKPSLEESFQKKPSTLKENKTVSPFQTQQTSCEQAIQSNSRSINQFRIMILSDAIVDRNGVGTYYKDLVDYLDEFVDRVTMIPAKANCYFKQRKLSLRLPGDYTQRIHFPNVLRISRYARNMKPNIILAPIAGPFGFFALILAKRHNARLIVGHHTAYEKLTQIYWKGMRAYVSSRFMLAISGFQMRSADAVVATSEEIAREALQFGAKQVHCIGTTVARPFLKRDISPISDKIKMVLYAGRLAAEKNVWSIFEAAQACPNLTFHIAGEGPERKALQAEAKGIPNVKLLGWLSRDQLLSQIDASDIIVLPSHIESFGTAALEGMARGRLALVSRHCGILDWPELAEGLYYIKENENLAAALKRIEQENPSDRKKKALLAYNLTRVMNGQALTHWLEILRGENCANA